MGFAYEEELHYLVAANDLEALGEPLAAEPLDVTPWHDYFGRVVRPHLERPARAGSKGHRSVDREPRCEDARGERHRRLPCHGRGDGLQ